jgi:hypothetical protein
VVLEHLHGAKSGTASQDFMAERTLVVLLALIDLLVVLMSFAYPRSQRRQRCADGRLAYPTF